MRSTAHAAQQAVESVTRFLRWRAPGSLVHDVQDDPRFQHRGVDLLWERPGEAVLGVEVKGDRNGRRGNYFLELISNFEKNTPGCFLYSEADWLAYVFLDRLELHLIPLREARAWFLPRAKELELKQARTAVGLEEYSTIGALLPIGAWQNEVRVERFSLADTIAPLENERAAKTADEAR